MKIVARAEPRYYVELSDEDAHLIHKVVTKRAAQHQGKFSNTRELTQSWVQHLELRKEYREVCLAAGHEVRTTQTVTASHIQLERVIKLLELPALMDVHTAQRLACICKLFNGTMDTASRQFRQFEISMSES